TSCRYHISSHYFVINFDVFANVIDSVSYFRDKRNILAIPYHNLALNETFSRYLANNARKKIYSRFWIRFSRKTKNTRDSAPHSRDKQNILAKSNSGYTKPITTLTQELHLS